MVGDVWQLRRGDELLAELHVTGSDFPWLIGHLEPQPGFVDVKPLLDEYTRVINSADHDGWSDIYRRLRAAVSLVAPDGHRVAEFALHLEDDDVSWRWSDTPTFD